jgi:nitrate reductase NapE component
MAAPRYKKEIVKLIGLYPLFAVKLSKKPGNIINEDNNTITPNIQAIFIQNVMYPILSISFIIV